MPQTFQVLRCFKCLVFQVHPTKKANKWKCKMCGEKQTIKRFYGLGTGKECRLHVQKLNGIQGEIQNAKLNSEDSDESTNSPDSIEQYETALNCKEQSENVPKAINEKSKWADYVDTTEENEQHSPDKTMQLNETEVVLEIPKKRLRKTQRVFKTPGPFSSENIHLPSTRVFNSSGNDGSVESKQSSTTLLHSQLIEPPAKKQHHNKGGLLPTVGNSKWAQYIEETENSNDDDADINDQTDFQNDPPKIFSLFDDDNIDAVLDF